MAPVDAADALSLVSEKLRGLEEEQAALSSRAVSQRQRNFELHAHLDLLSQGIFPPGTRSVLVIVLMALIGSVVAGALVWRSSERDAAGQVRRMMAATQPLSPRLLITSEPSGAEVVLDGAPRGVTPLLITEPGKQVEHRAALVFPGFEQQTRTIHVQAQAGAHLHVVLRPSVSP